MGSYYGTHLKTITGHTDAVASVTFSPDGTTLATRSWDKTIRLWDATTGQLRHTLIGHQDDVDVVVFGPNARTLASGSQDDTVQKHGQFRRHRQHWDVLPVTGR